MAWRGAYAIIIFVSFVNLIFPSNAFPILSFNWYAPHSYFWTMTIPPNPSQNPFGQYNETAVLNVTVSAPQPFADGVPITVSVLGCDKAGENVTADKFFIGFTGAYDHKNPGSIYNGYTVEAWSFLYPKPPNVWPNNCPPDLGPNAVHFIGEFYDTTFYFENPGLYPVSVEANYWPNLFGPPIKYDYPNNVINIESSTVLNQSVVGRAESLVVIATFAFGFLELYPTLKKRFQ